MLQRHLSGKELVHSSSSSSKAVRCPVFTCELCGQSMTHAYSMQRHRRQHLTKPKSFACDVCGRRYNRRDNLLVHCRTHYSWHLRCGLPHLWTNSPPESGIGDVKLRKMGYCCAFLFAFLREKLLVAFIALLASLRSPQEKTHWAIYCHTYWC